MGCSHRLRQGSGLALQTPRALQSAIHEAFDFAVIDRESNLVRAISGIPIKASPPAIPPKPMLVPVHRFEDKMYAAFLEPIASKSGGAVGLISVFEDVTRDQQLLRRSAIFNTVVAALLWTTTVSLSDLWAT